MMVCDRWLEEVSSQSGFFVASLSLLTCAVDSFRRLRIRHWELNCYSAIKYLRCRQNYLETIDPGD